MRRDSALIACHENLESLLSRGRGQLLHAVAHQAPAYPLFQASLPAARLLPFDMTRRVRPFLNDDQVLVHSDLAARLSGAGVRGFIPSYRASPRLERWAADAGPALLSPPHALQRRLEDKVEFHALMARLSLPTPSGLVLHAPDQLGLLPAGPLVCQVPFSEGMDGTFLVRSASHLGRRLRAGELRLPLLCRELVKGLVLGITVVVGQDQVLLSAVRHQCRGLRQRDRGLAGIQWVARSRLPPEGRRAIGRAMAALGRGLATEGFRGVANIDFILAGEQVRIIECNPRFSAATPQLAAWPELLHGLDLMSEHLSALQGEPLSRHRPTLPATDFEGATVDFSDWTLAVMRASGRRTVATLPELGVHAFAGQRLRQVSLDVAELRGPERLLFHYSTPAGPPPSRRSDFGTLITAFPMFSFRRPRAVLTRPGASLMGQLERQVTFRRPRCTLADLLAT